MEISGTMLDSLAFWRADQSLEKARDVALSMAASAVRGYSGSAVGRLGARQERTLILFEKESCPFSRLVRETLSILDLDAEMLPCPEGEEVHHAELCALGGAPNVPFLIDPANAVALYDSGRIVRYLFETYGDGRVPAPLRGPLAVHTSKLASALRGHAGDEHEPARRPMRPLELYGYEAGPHTRLVREQLSAYALPWICRNRAHGSPRRAELEADIGPTRFPYLRDPNTGRGLRESEIIRGYLTATYGRG